jgi:acyl-CoA synthetase (AMP-forming)/AMP-acid ligase II
MLSCSAARFPTKTAIIDGERRLDYRTFDDASTRLANYLIEHLNVGKGEKVALLSRNRLEYGIVFFGTARSGAVLVNISTMYGPQDLTYALEKSDTVVLIYEHHFADLVAKVKADLPAIRAYVEIPDAAEQPTGFLDLLAGCGAHEPEVEIQDTDPFCINYTGGTTGLPKGALVSHRARANAAHGAAFEEGMTERDVVCVVTPLFHIGGLNLLFQPAILVGATVVLTTKWSVEGFADLCERHAITTAFLVPTQVIAILSEPGLDFGRLASWTKLVVGGAPVADETQIAMGQRLPQVGIVQIYGQTEIGLVCTTRPWHLPAKLGACGRPTFNVQVAVVDPDGNPVTPGEIGEVVSRGENVMLGYYNEPEQTAKFFKHGDGWAWTGDLAKIDEDGFITLVDRANDMIICGGVNIYPKEIEKVLYRHAAVGECAVFGVPDPKWGEISVASIRLAPGMTATAAEIDQFCREQTSRFKCPKRIEFVDDFPRTPVGKIQKNVLRERFRAA